MLIEKAMYKIFIIERAVGKLVCIILRNIKKYSFFMKLKQYKLIVNNR